ncbi:MAG: protein translocase subunit SecF [Sphaerochaetaceae bacterium]
MAKKIYPITTYRFVAIAISALLLIAGLVGFLAFGGFNLSIDFQSGFSQRVQIAPPALQLSYSGTDSVSMNVSSGTVVFITRDSGGTKYQEFSAVDYPTSDQMAKAITGAVKGVEATALNPQLQTSALITGFGTSPTLSEVPITLNSANADVSSFVSIEQMRSVLGMNAQVQIVGSDYRQVFQLRIANDDNLSEQEISSLVSGKLAEAFGSDSVVILQSDFVGPKYSANLISSSILIVIVAIILILLYIWFRFRLAYALASIITLVHDTLVLIGFIALFRLEVSTTTIAAILTIIGYSLNNVIVVFDRVRENRPLLKGVAMRQILDTSVSQSLTRTLYSSLTTVLAILPLALLASGAIQLFAVEMVFGIVVGAYSCNFLAPALLLWITKDKQEQKPVKAAPVLKVVEQEQESEEQDTTEQAEEKPAEPAIPTVERKLKGKRQQKK